MIIELLNKDNLRQCVTFEKEARDTEPGVLYGNFEEENFYEKTLSSLNNIEFQNARTLLCLEDNKVIGRLDFCILSSYAFSGSRQVYVDWIYVLKEYRHKKNAQCLFKEMEKYLKNVGIDFYFLTVAENEEAQKFYHNFENANIKKQEILQKEI